MVVGAIGASFDGHDAAAARESSVSARGFSDEGALVMVAAYDELRDAGRRRQRGAARGPSRS